uniref:BTB domain-containing protein n=1 Tax=Amphimedon queenslandica TaxID=400682 RepID=A0A1X7UYZ5_AMPQE
MAAKKTVVRRFVWSQYPDCGFPLRVNHCSVIARNGRDGRDYMYSIGGFHETDEEKEKRIIYDDNPYFNTGPIDMYCMDIATCNWVEVNFICGDAKKEEVPPIRGGVPPRRYGHACVAYGDKIFMYGGRNDDDGSFRVMECFDITRSMWLKIHATAEGCSLPRSRDGHACTANGLDVGSYRHTNDLYAFDMDTYIWTLLPQNSDRHIAGRDFHTATLVDGKIVAFGGRCNEIRYEKAFFEYSLNKKKWTIVEPSGYQPEGRRSHCAVRYSENKVLYFGGYNSKIERHFNDVFIYDSLNQHTVEVIPFGIPPVPRRRCGYCIINNEVIFCGGTSPRDMIINGEKRSVLHDHSDTIVLSLLPTLQQLAMIAVKELELDAAVLPIHIRQQLQNF